MSVLSSGLDYVDVQFLGYPQIIATAILHSPAGVALVDPWPSSTLSTLRTALSGKGIHPRDIRAIVLTHIHLDHAGATGTLVRELGDVTVYVHERGATHMIDPARLLDSANRLYGADMNRLWGEFLPVPAANVRALKGGETIEVAGRRLEVAYTPGHASHHVCYFDRASGVAFTGDVTGIRRASGRYVMPPTPPPDIDLERWQESLDRVLAWSPRHAFHHALRPMARRRCARPGHAGAAARLGPEVARARRARRSERRAADEGVPAPDHPGSPPHDARVRGGVLRARRTIRLLVAGVGTVLEKEDQ